MAKLLSVLMPVYNGATHVREAIQSILQQTLRDFELLIMDDGSTDATPHILKRFAEQDPRIRIFLRQRRGQIAVRNELLRLASSDIIACADADDICLPDRFERQFTVISQASTLWVLGTAVISINEQGGHRRKWRVPIGTANVSAELEHRCCIAHPSAMMRAKNIRAIGGYRAAYECAEDYDLFLRASERGQVDNLPAIGILYRQHEGNVSHRYIVRQEVSADLARATHRLRLQGHPDPTEGLATPPQLHDPIVTALIPAARIERHRMMGIALDDGASDAETNSAGRYFLHARLGKKETRTSQRAILRLILRRSWGSLGVRLALRAALLGPGRLARLIWKLRKTER